MKINSWLRLKGLIAFVIILALFAVFAFFLAAPITKSVLQSSLSAMNGARVDINDVDIQYSPFALTIKGIEVADPSSPMVNSLQIDEVKFSLVFSSLLLRKVFIDQMSVEGVKINTPRKVSGMLETAKEPKDVTASDQVAGQVANTDAMSIDLPDVGELLKNESLLTDTAITHVESDAADASQRIDAIKQHLGDKARWDAYQQRYDEIRAGLKGNAKQKLAALKDAKKLSHDLKTEQATFKQSRDAVRQDIKQVKNGIAEVKQAIKQDKQNLKQKYTGSASTGNVVGLIFGEQVGEYTSLVRQWYTRIKPYIESDDEAVTKAPARTKGEYVRFEEYRPQPDFYLLTAAISAQLPSGDYEGKLNDVSSDQQLIKKPAVLRLHGKSMKDRELETVYAEYNATNPDKAFTKINYVLKNYKLKNFEVSGDKDMPIEIEAANMTLKIDALLESGQIQAGANSDFTNVKFKTGAGGSSLKGMINDALKNVNQFDLRAQANGEIKSLDFDVSSNIDNQVGAAVNKAINQRLAKFEQELQDGLQQKYADKLAKLEQASQSLDALQQSIQAKETELSNKLSRLK